MLIRGQAEQAAEKIIEAFRNPNTLPKPLAQIFIRKNDNVPCRSWSWRNQLLVALAGHCDARGFRQWQQVGRSVKKAEKAVYILSPITRRVQDEDSDQDRTIVIGFKGTPVFGLEQTEGEPLPAPDPEIDAWVNSLPVIDVSRVWGLSVETFDGKNSRALGSFRPGAGIALGVKNLSTFAHELIHAADHKNGNLKELGQHWRSEIVAELGGAVLLQILGFDHESDLGGCWAYINHYADNAEIDVLDACGKVLQRTCDAVSLILETAEQIKNNSEAVHV